MSDLKDAQKMQKMAEEIKDVLEFNDLGIYEEDGFNIKKDEDSEEYTIELKIRDVKFQFYVRFKDPDNVSLDEDNSNHLEFNVYEDIWEEFRSYDYTAKKPILSLLFDACAKLQN